MNRKKSLAAVLLLCTVFGFTACGTKEQTKNGVTTKKVDKQAATDISNVYCNVIYSRMTFYAFNTECPDL